MGNVGSSWEKGNPIVQFNPWWLPPRFRNVLKDQERRFRFAVFQAPQDEYLGSSKAEVDEFD